MFNKPSIALHGVECDIFVLLAIVEWKLRGWRRRIVGHWPFECFVLL
jgi:hypothetical protein